MQANNLTQYTKTTSNQNHGITYHCCHRRVLLIKYLPDEGEKKGPICVRSEDRSIAS